MRHDFLDSQSRFDSLIHHLPAGFKLFSALLIIILLVLLPVSVGAWLGAVLVVVAFLSRLPVGFLVKRLLLLEPFVLGVTLLALFQPDGWLVFVTIVIRSTLCLFTMVLLSSTTPFAELLRVLKRVRVPALLVTTLALMYRYLFVLVDEAERMQRARVCRTFDRRRWHGWKALGTVVGQLFVRSSERAERIYAAMVARGWK
jgi:cobalt/nickel transport system permease protein